MPDGEVTGEDAGMKEPALSGTRLARGDAELIEVFAQGAEVWVVDRDGVTRRALADGSELARWEGPRPLASAAFDDATLVVSDGAKLTVLDPNTLEASLDANLLAACANGVVLGDRFVCGASVNQFDDVVYYTYDTATGDLIASSQAFYREAITLRAIPGRDAFVAGSSYEFTVYEMAETGEIVSRGQSPFSSNHSTASFAFDSSMNAKSLITSEGLLLRVDTCDGSGVLTCFENNGALGTLTGAQRFVGMDVVGDAVFGLINTSSSTYPFDRSGEPTNFLLQVTDVPSREINYQEVATLSAGQIVALRGLPEQQAVVVGYALSSAQYPYTSTGDGYEVRALPVGD